MADADTEARLARIEAALGLPAPVARASLPVTPGGWEGRRYCDPRVRGCGCPVRGVCVRQDCPHQASDKISQCRDAVAS